MVRFAWLALALACACVPSHSALYGPVDREVAVRLGVTDARVPGAVHALLAAPLDRDAAIRIGLAENHRLAAELDELGIAAAELADATVLTPTEVDLDDKLVGGHEIEVSAIQDVLGLIQLPQRRGAANAELAAARARAVAATVSLAHDLELAWIDAVAAGQVLALRQTAFDAASASAELASRMHAAGNTSDLALAREEAQREDAGEALATAKLAVTTTRERLGRALGVDEDGWTVVARLPELPAAAPPLDQLEQDAVDASLELAALHDDADAANRRLGVARVRAIVPALGVGAAAARRDGGDWELGPALRLGLPIFDQQQGPRARAHAEEARARDLATAVERELRADARAVAARVQAGYDDAVHHRDVIVPLRQQILDETLKQYDAMNASTFELIAARRDVVDAGAAYVDALRTYWIADADARALAHGADPSQEDAR